MTLPLRAWSLSLSEPGPPPLLTHHDYVICVCSLMEENFWKKKGSRACSYISCMSEHISQYPTLSQQSMYTHTTKHTCTDIPIICYLTTDKLTYFPLCYWYLDSLFCVITSLVLCWQQWKFFLECTIFTTPCNSLRIFFPLFSHPTFHRRPDKVKSELSDRHIVGRKTGADSVRQSYKTSIQWVPRVDLCYLNTGLTRLGLKCQIPFSLQRSSFMKFILGLQIMLSLNKFLGLKKFLVSKNLCSEKKFVQKKVLGP